MEGKFLPGFGVLVPRPPSHPPVATIPNLTRRRKLPPIKTRTMKKHKGAYSDIVTSFKFEVKKKQAFVPYLTSFQSFILHLAHSWANHPQNTAYGILPAQTKQSFS